MDTFLVSPIDGVVTGVFRNVGDYVRAAQAVIRVENDAEIALSISSTPSPTGC